MHLPTYHLRPILMVLGMLCLAPANTSAQQDATTGRKPPVAEAEAVTIRPTASSRRGVPVEVIVSKTRVRVRERVAFTLVPKYRTANPRFTVNFGDGKEIQTSSTQLEHQYHHVGHYDVFAWITPDADKPADPDPTKMPRVSLSATPDAVSPGSVVAFSAKLDPTVSNIKYRFGFGDSGTTDWQDSPQTERSYNSQGTYYAFVEIGTSSRGAVRLINRSARVAVKVTQPALQNVDLTVNPNPAEVGQSVTFTALVVPQVPNVVYRFSFGEGSANTGWQASSQTTYAYSGARTYPASVDIGMTTGGLVKPLGSARESVRVTPQVLPATPTPTPTPTPSPSPTSSPTPSPSPSGSPNATPSASTSPTVPPFLITASSPDAGDNGRKGPWGLPFQAEDWWKFVLIALALAGGGYWGWKALFPPRPSFAARPDPGGADVYTGAQPLTIESQVILNPNISEGQYLVYTDEPSIVRSIRRDNG